MSLAQVWFGNKKDLLTRTLFLKSRGKGNYLNHIVQDMAYIKYAYV